MSINSFAHRFIGYGRADLKKGTAKFAFPFFWS